MRRLWFLTVFLGIFELPMFADNLKNSCAFLLTQINCTVRGGVIEGVDYTLPSFGPGGERNFSSLTITGTILLCENSPASDGTKCQIDVDISDTFVFALDPKSFMGLDGMITSCSDIPSMAPPDDGDPCDAKNGTTRRQKAFKETVNEDGNELTTYTAHKGDIGYFKFGADLPDRPVTYTLTSDFNTIPEPDTLELLAIGLILIAIFRSRHSRA